MGKIIINEVQPMDEIRMSCYKHALYPIINYLGNDIDHFLINDMEEYYLTDDGSLKLKEIDSFLYIAGQLGYELHVKEDQADFIYYLKNKIKNNQPVLVMCDTFELPMLKKDVHTQHAICVFGYDDEERVFHIIEHNSDESFIYEKETISFEILECASMSCEKYFGHVHIATVTKIRNNPQNLYSFHKRIYLENEKKNT